MIKNASGVKRKERERKMYEKDKTVCLRSVYCGALASVPRFSHQLVRGARRCVAPKCSNDAENQISALDCSATHAKEGECFSIDLDQNGSCGERALVGAHSMHPLLHHSIRTPGACWPSCTVAARACVCAEQSALRRRGSSARMARSGTKLMKYARVMDNCVAPCLCLSIFLLPALRHRRTAKPESGHGHGQLLSD